MWENHLKVGFHIDKQPIIILKNGLIRREQILEEFQAHEPFKRVFTQRWSLTGLNIFVGPSRILLFIEDFEKVFRMQETLNRPSKCRRSSKAFLVQNTPMRMKPLFYAYRRPSRGLYVYQAFKMSTFYRKSSRGLLGV